MALNALSPELLLYVLDFLCDEELRVTLPAIHRLTKRIRHTLRRAPAVWWHGVCAKLRIIDGAAAAVTSDTHEINWRLVWAVFHSAQQQLLHACLI